MATQTKPSSGSEPIVIEHQPTADDAAETLGSAIDTLTAFAHLTQRVGTELTHSTTAAFRDGFELSAKVQGAVLDASRDAIGSFSFTASPMDGWNRLWETSARAYTDYVNRVAGTADEVSGKIREAVHALSDEVSANLARVGR